MIRNEDFCKNVVGKNKKMSKIKINWKLKKSP